MNAADQRQFSPDNGIIWLSIVVPAGCGLDWAFPQNNQVGALILTRLIESALDAQGLNAGRASSIGGLNRSLFTFHVQRSHLAQGLQLVRKELEKLCLIGAAKFGFWDERELIFRAVHPAVEQMIKPPWCDELMAEFAASRNLRAAATSTESPS